MWTMEVHVLAMLPQSTLWCFELCCGATMYVMNSLTEQIMVLACISYLSYWLHALPFDHSSNI
jgi:hypothetical protein